MKVISYTQARALGLVRYYTGEPCLRKHVCERFVCNRGCVDCMRGALPGGLTAEQMQHRIAERIAGRVARAAFRQRVKEGEIALRMRPEAPHPKEWYYDKGWSPSNLIESQLADWVETVSGVTVPAGAKG